MTIYRHTFEIQELIFSRQGNQSLLYMKRQSSENFTSFQFLFKFQSDFQNPVERFVLKRRLALKFFSRDTDALSLMRVFNHYCFTYWKVNTGNDS